MDITATAENSIDEAENTGIKVFEQKDINAHPLSTSSWFKSDEKEQTLSLDEIENDAVQELVSDIVEPIVTNLRTNRNSAEIRDISNDTIDFLTHLTVVRIPGNWFAHTTSKINLIRKSFNPSLK
jgi:hypothetical protein